MLVINFGLFALDSERVRVSSCEMLTVSLNLKTFRPDSTGSTGDGLRRNPPVSRQARRIYKSILVKPPGFYCLVFLGMFPLLVSTWTRRSATHAFPISTREQT